MIHKKVCKNETFVMADYLEASDIYRSTESFIAAKLGLEGTYLEVAVPEGKTVESAVVDGTVCDNVDTEDGAAYVIASDKEYYTIVLNFADGTSKTYHIGTLRGDVNGDYTVDILDALKILNDVVNRSTVATGDYNGDNKVNLLDVIRIMKLLTK